jgi:transcriptional regulator with XRE-family HTH domain
MLQSAATIGTRQTSAQPESFAFTPHMGVVQQLGTLLRELRDEQKINRVAIGARLHTKRRGKSESALGKFERAESTPRNLDAVVEAYSEELEVPIVEIWRLALERYERGEAPAGVERAVSAAARASRRASGKPAASRGAKARRRAG